MSFSESGSNTSLFDASTWFGRSSRADAFCFGTAAGMTFTTTQARGDQNRCLAAARSTRSLHVGLFGV
jgi:hypothetical protein